jgi:hypothetical protein
MSPQQKGIDIIHNCERHFYEWLKVLVHEKGIDPEKHKNLSEILKLIENNSQDYKQHIKPLIKWDKTKNECYILSDKLNGSAENDEELSELIEKTAFEGQILCLTLRDE